MVEDPKVVGRILDVYGISAMTRNTLIFDLGQEFLQQFHNREEMGKESLFWFIWQQMFYSDDVALTNHPECWNAPYFEVKRSILTDKLIKREFCRAYYGQKDAQRRNSRSKGAAAASQDVTAKSRKERQPSDMNIWRKRLFAAIGGWLRLSGQEERQDIIMGIACRAAGAEEFNKIPKARLVSLYNAFLQKQRDLKSVKAIEINPINK